MKKSNKIPYNPRLGDITFTKPSKTQQNMRDEVDINQVIAKYHKTGILPQIRNTAQPQYADYTNLGDYHEAQNKIMRANALFEQIPAHTRRKFEDDPAKFLEFATNPENQDAMVEMGLIDPSSLPSRSTEPSGDPTGEPGEENASGVVSDNPTEA